MLQSWSLCGLKIQSIPKVKKFVKKIKKIIVKKIAKQILLKIVKEIVKSDKNLISCSLRIQFLYNLDATHF